MKTITKIFAVCIVFMGAFGMRANAVTPIATSPAVGHMQLAAQCLRWVTGYTYFKGTKRYYTCTKPGAPVEHDWWRGQYRAWRLWQRGYHCTWVPIPQTKRIYHTYCAQWG